MEPMLRVTGPVALVEHSGEQPAFPLPESVAEKIRVAAEAFVRKGIDDATEDQPDLLVLTDPIEDETPESPTPEDAAEAILQEIDEDELIASILAQDTGLSEEMIRKIVRIEAARAAEDAHAAEKVRVLTGHQKTEAELQLEADRLERRRKADAEAREFMEEARARDEAARSQAVHARQREIANNNSTLRASGTAVTMAAPNAMDAIQSGADGENPFEDAKFDAVENGANVGEYDPRNRVYAAQSGVADQREWGTVSDHRMSSAGRVLWRVGVYGTLLALPLVLFSTSPYSPSDTLAHHLTGVSCQFGEGLGMVNIKEGEPGYHARHDHDGDGIACEKRKARPMTQSAGNARFIRPQ